MNKYMEIAKKLSDENLITNHGGPFGAVIVKDNKVSCMDLLEYIISTVSIKDTNCIMCDS